ncbi:DNA photolyase family protein [Solirubrobacter ginsenosidimutans]|uniref:DNA photolyase family protein n=1 Tax=Solirubrobacter ginsenosidimutans TaxID=490573 RepID=A0A9X3MXH0_9ACTN|nr:deoxyribodipyrimidine photo-lyase [Solirubrobacter ginsenosidimutans]MDA0164524.1 DNA photolyase family protein [Solirubrobacter ginsenosidimutans]
MPSTALVWFRRDLRVHDHPPLRAALDAHDLVVPVFVLDDRLLLGRHASGSRTRFMLECLTDLRAALRQRGGDLVIARGTPEQELRKLASQCDATAVYFASDASPFAMRRDQRVEAALREVGVEPRRTPGNFVADIGKPKPYAVFTPFWRAWKELPRRELHGAPRVVPIPAQLRAGELPDLKLQDLVPDPLKGGETEGRKRMHAWLRDGIDTYAQHHDRVSGGTSMLSPYLHFGCISARELEAKAGRHDAYTRQLAWRDFYAHVLLHNPGNARHAYRKELDDIEWDGSDEHFDAWREGRTGYPIVDAGMRELKATGWMHNRARLITACFLVKDLHIDWRQGERHFMQLLLDGDEANNNGNWQWISSVGVDPAPVTRRLYNPMLQQERHDPEGTYVRRWVPELSDVPLNQLAKPWEAGHEAPIVDHAVERRRTLDAYAAARS